MALSAGMGGGHRRNRRRGSRRQPLSEINVTPLVDVMLVLLIIFMISAPLLTAGIEVDLPETEAAAIEQNNEPLTVTIRKDGALFLQDEALTYDELSRRLNAIAAESPNRPVFLRGDQNATWGDGAKVMAKLQTSGLKVSVITDTSGSPPAAPAADEATAPAAEAP
jgi:biopolymer transport protein TolR